MISFIHLSLLAYILLFQGFNADPSAKKRTNSESSSITIDGSSTVFPVTSAIAQLFSRSQPTIPVEVTAHGTGSGFQRFVNGEINIAQASRPISATESAQLKSRGLDFLELTVGYDGVTLVVHPENTFVSELTLEELRKIWSGGSKIKRWSDVRPGWPSTPISFYGPGKNHGTTDFFTNAVAGNSGSLRDYAVVENDDYVALVDAIAADKNGFGFVTYAYYVRNFKRIKAVGISQAGSTVMPTYANITNGSYQPFSRPMFLYVAKNELHRTEMETFLDFYLNVAAALVKKVGYVPLSREAYADQKDQLDAAVRQLKKDAPNLTK